LARRQTGSWTTWPGTLGLRQLVSSPIGKVTRLPSHDILSLGGRALAPYTGRARVGGGLAEGEPIGSDSEAVGIRRRHIARLCICQLAKTMLTAWREPQRSRPGDQATAQRGARAAEMTPCQLASGRPRVRALYGEDGTRLTTCNVGRTVLGFACQLASEARPPSSIAHTGTREAPGRNCQLASDKGQREPRSTGSKRSS
jgi:hypothetical protein